LRLRAKDTDLRFREIFQNDRRHIGQRTLSVFLQNKDGMLRADFFDFALERRGNIARCFVGDDRDPFFPFQPKTIADGISRSGLELRIDRDGVVAVRHGLASGQFYAKFEAEQRIIGVTNRITRAPRTRP
jgi:hypothetical protein